jgi:hypothetical protein
VEQGDAQTGRRVVATEIEVNLGRLYVNLTNVMRGPSGSWRPRT